VSCDKSNLGDLITCLEKAAGRFVPQIMEPQIEDAKIATRTTKGSANRAPAVGEYPAESLGHGRLLG